MIDDRRCFGKRALSVGCLIVALALSGVAQNSQADGLKQSPANHSGSKEAGMTRHASGTFEVKMEPLSEDKSDGTNLGKFSLSKHFHGALEGSSKGEMLAAMSSAQGSAGYVAMERFSGSLDGRSGTFVFQHSSTMTRGTPQQSVTVVPDSGTGDLVGLAGTMVIHIADGKHSFDFEYTLAGTH